MSDVQNPSYIIPRPLKNVDSFFEPLSETDLAPFFFVRKLNSQHGKKQYYLYTYDQTTLLLSSVAFEKENYVISQSATQLVIGTSTYVGSLRPDSNSSSSFIAIDNKSSISMRIRFDLPNKDVVEKFRTVAVDLKNKVEVQQKLPVLVDGQYHLQFPSQGGIISTKNFIIERNGDIVFSFQKKLPEEHLLFLKYPFSLFQGFALALSMML